MVQRFISGRKVEAAANGLLPAAAWLLVIKKDSSPSAKNNGSVVNRVISSKYISA
jgi:hypothetical protein